MRLKYVFQKLAILFLLLNFTSCEQDAEVDPPVFEKKPVIMCLITPQSNFIQAELSYTRPYYGEQTYDRDFIDDALVVIKNMTTGDMDTLKYLINGNFPYGNYEVFPKNLQVINDTKYELLVRLSNGETFTATTTTPPKADLNKLKITYFDLQESREDEWGEQVNDYSLEFTYEGLKEGFFVSPQMYGVFNDKNGQEYEIEAFFKEPMLSADASGNVKFFTRDYFYSGWGIDPPFTIEKYKGAVYTMDKSYRDFYNVRFQDDGNPFAEPVLFLSNFSEGALGVFGSYDFDKGEVLIP